MATSKVAVVTGSNKGIGFAIVQALCQKFKGVVYLTARDESRGKAAVAELNKLNLKPEFHQLDITCKKSIVKFADFIKIKHGGLDVLVNNAAIAYKNAATEPFSEQAEVSVAVNYLALVDVCEALFPLLRPHARVVHISSSAGHLLRIPSTQIQERLKDPSLTVERLSELMQEFVKSAAEGKNKEQGWGQSAYAVSKVGVTALTRIQQRQFDTDPRPGITVNAVHPGYVATDMSSHKGNLTIEQGADVPVHMALWPVEEKAPRGQYVWNDRRIVSWTEPMN
uniref:carbonyl reductase (NADPH) n=1 Tax=Graphocephala atropunctata TaxID=36148 RepID=A0A1B6KVH8_9HEMI